MPRGYVYNPPPRGETPVEEAFRGSTLVTNADMTRLHAQHIYTVGEFAKQASDADLTDLGFPSEDSIRLIRVFENSDFRDLLDYEVQQQPVVAPVVPPPAPVAAPPAAPVVVTSNPIVDLFKGVLTGVSLGFYRS